MVLAEFAIFPMDKGVSLSPYVARVLDIIDQSGLAYKLTPMATIMEGEWKDVLKVVDQCYRALDRDCDRVIVHLRVDARKRRKNAIEGKVRSVERKVGRKLKK